MKKSKTELIIGNFYMAYGGHQHPSLIIAYNERQKTFISIKFGTTQGKHMIEIHPIQVGINKSFVHTRPFEGTRKDYGDRKLIGLSIDERDNVVIEIIKRREPTKSKRAKKRYKNKKCR